MDARVSDALAVVAWSSAETAPELHLANALRFHRDWLNGGLQQASFNQRDEIVQCIAAFGFFGLPAINDLVAETVRYRDQGGSEGWDYEFGAEDFWEELDSRYDAWVYADGKANEDRIEQHILLYIGSHQEEFARLVAVSASS